jgi:hypothetical protein
MADGRRPTGLLVRRRHSLITQKYLRPSPCLDFFHSQIFHYQIYLLGRVVSYSKSFTKMIDPFIATGFAAIVGFCSFIHSVRKDRRERRERLGQVVVGISVITPIGLKGTDLR